MKNKNILIITDYMAPYEGNFIMSLKKLEQSIIDEGGAFYYFFPTNSSKIEWVKKMNNVYFFNKSIKSNINIFNKFIKENNIDVIYSHFCLPKTQLAIKISRILNKNIKLVQHFHNHYELPNNIIKKVLFKFVFKGDINIGCSKDVAESIPYSKKKVTYVTNAIDFSRLDKYENINLADDKFVILMFGYTYERKGIDLAIKAIRKLANKNIILAISISKNPNEFKQNIIKDFGKIPSFVKILKPRNDIATYYKASNLFLSTAREEGFCYAIVEAIYCGKPCICTKLPGQPNEIPYLITVEPENIEEISQKIMLVLEEKNNFLASKAKKYVTKTYGIDNWVKEIKKVIIDEKR